MTTELCVFVYFICTQVYKGTKINLSGVPEFTSLFFQLNNGKTLSNKIIMAKQIKIGTEKEHGKLKFPINYYYYYF